MSDDKRSAYRWWIIVFAIVFFLSFVPDIFGLRAYISIIIRNPELMETGLGTLIRSSIVTFVDGVLFIVAVILSLRTAYYKSSTHQKWFLVIAAGFALKFVFGLTAGIRHFNILSQHDFTETYRMEFYMWIGGSIVILAYGALAVVATVLSRRMALKS
ncbi:MAG: hypothetical protein A2158_02480 [Chloroflexi bacterium RBG_13_46_14]|nr:MAG: hypothetical protein A2158_02480 [Chloroflexi bacterium RBG_13_46_14]